MPGASFSKLATALVRLLDQSAAPLYLLDARRRLVYCNQACAQWVGVPTEQLVGRRCDYHSDPTADAACRLCPPPEAFGGKPCWSEVAPSENASARRVEFEPLADARGEVVAVLAIASSLAAPQAGAEQLELDSAAAIHRWLARFYARYRRAVPVALVGKSSAVALAQARFDLATASDANVLVVGPPGSGTVEIARTIHLSRHGQDSGALATLPCAELGEELLQSTCTWLMQTSAREDLPAALILKDVDRLPGTFQTRLAEAVAAGQLNARLLSTAQSDLAEPVRGGGFLPDLAARLATITIELPPLADRVEDVPLVAQALLEEENARGGKQLSGFSPEAIDRLLLYTWPGNLLELSDVVSDARGRAEGPLIGPHDLPDFFRHVVDAQAYAPEPEETIVLDTFLAQIELELIERALAKAKGNKTRAAELLGMNRPRFYRRLVQLGLIAESEDAEQPL
jgi:DNA-binding NtrC family response regulator